MLIENWQFSNPTDWGLNGFRAWALTEDVLLLEVVPVPASLGKIDGVFRRRCLDCFLSLKQITLEHVPDWVNTLEWAPAYVSMGICFDPHLTSIDDLWAELKSGLAEALSMVDKQRTDQPQVLELPVCYKKGLDWTRIQALSGLSKDEFIQRHSSGDYWVAAIGFLPGFTFLDGLEPSLTLPRLHAPRTNTPAGTVGIGGNQTGWYALSSPGGWNSLGETPLEMLNPKAGISGENPSPVQVGDRIRFRAVDEEEFDALKKASAEGDMMVDTQLSIQQALGEKSMPVSNEKKEFGADELVGDTTKAFISFEVLEPGLWTSLQDSGRSTGLAYGLPRSGAADSDAYQAALQAVGGQQSGVVIETTLKGPVLRCHNEAVIVLTGADFQVRCERPVSTRLILEETQRDSSPTQSNSWKLPLHTLIRLQAGDVLRWGMSHEGCRGYMAVRAADFAGQKYWGSVSSLPGQGAFKTGDILRWKGLNQSEDTLQNVKSDQAFEMNEGAQVEDYLEMIHDHDMRQNVVMRHESEERADRFAGIPRFRCQKGPEWDWIPEELLEYVMGSEYEVGSDSNRMGIRLSRRVVDEAREHYWLSFLAELPSMWSSVVQPGIIQCPTSGQPIVLGPDGQTIGGYPRIAYIPRNQQWRLAQLRPGDRVRLGWG